ncbi:hypothetical protein [Treponema zioleckii]|uniref:hypothetical protein n=1 Tax=Treponema zioleckii TaxID=331680 RepID=UPI00168B2FC5|nr:hypothetical protein [Treponema zioleckii]
MKKLVSTLTAVLSAAVLFVSCGKQQTPDEQFKSAIRNRIMGTTEKLVGGVSDSCSGVDFSNFGSNGKVKLSLDEGTAALIQGLIATQLPNIDVSWFKSINLDVNAILNDGKLKESLGFGLNDTNIVTFDLLFELENGNFYFRVPELLKNYFKVNGSTLGMQDAMKIYLAEIQLFKSAPSKKVFTGFVDEVLTAVLAGVNGVERTEETLTAGLDVDESKKVSANYNALLFKLTPEYATATAENVKKAVSESKNLRTLLDWIIPVVNDLQIAGNLNADEVTNKFAEALAEVFASTAELEDVSVIVYADSKSNMQGYKVAQAEGSAFESIFTQKGNDFGFEMKATEPESEVFAVNGFGSLSGGKMTGDFKVSAYKENVFLFSTDKLDVEGLKSFKGNGAITLRLADNYQRMMKETLQYSVGESAVALAKNLALTLKMEEKSAKKGSFELILGDGEKASYVTLKCDSEYKKSNKIELPAESVDVETIGDEETMNLIGSIKTDEIVENLKKANVPEEYTQIVSMYDGQTILSLIH